MANTLKHKTIPPGTDRVGFTGVTPSLYAEEHAFSGGQIGSVLVRNTGNSDGAGWVATANGILAATGVSTFPTFTAVLPSIVMGNITATGTVTSGTWSGLFGAVTGANLTNLTAANLTGTVADARLSANVPLRDLANNFIEDNIFSSHTTNDKILTIGNAPASNAKSVIKMVGSNSAINWQIGTTTGGAFTFTPSTAGGGTTFTTAVVTFTSGGMITAIGTGNHTLGAGGAGAQSTLTIDSSSAASSGAYLALASAGTPKCYVGTESGIIGGGSTNTHLTLYTVAGNSIKFYPNAALAWGMNSAADWTFGTSSHIADSSGTPTITGSVGGSTPTIAGTDYSHVITSNGANTSITVGFGHTFSTTPIVVTCGSSATVSFINAVSTSAYTLNFSAAVPAKIYVLVRSY